jgi:uncharacterized protein YecE (DUF72 family)
MAHIYIGTASFSGKDLDGSFYPKGIKPAERIAFYAERFNAVEVDSSYYALPSTRNSILFNQRTPDDFIFHFKAFGLMTGHRIQTRRLGRSLAMHLPPLFNKSYIEKPAPDLLKTAFDMFYEALYPLKASNKLGLILFQYPPYFSKNTKNKEYILQCKEWMGDYSLAIEFRHASWIKDVRGSGAGIDELADTMRFLSENGLSYVSVDEPQFKTGSTIPPIANATTKTAYIRFHGRNTKNWFKKDAGVEGRFDYLYDEDELREWVPKIEHLAENTDQVHIMFNNCVNIYPVKNAGDMAAMLGALPDKRPVEIISQASLEL